MSEQYTYTLAPRFPGRIVWTPDTGWTDDGPTVERWIDSQELPINPFGED